MTHPVEVLELTRRFGDFIAVDAVTFTVNEGEIFGFLGPNGAGKTTTIKMLSGLLSPSGGVARVAGFDVATEADSIKRHIGYMSQLFSLYSDLTVGENISLFSGLYGLSGRGRTARRDWVLEMSGLERQVDMLTGDLPLGWKQRLALGCALLHEPPILFLDEPTSGVDPVSRRNFWDLINELSAGGTTVLVSTHHMEEAEYCNRMALMNRGRLIALAPAAELRDSLGEPLLEIIADDPAGAVQVLQETDGVIDATMYGRAVHVIVDDPGLRSNHIIDLLAASGREVRSVRPIPPTLEDVFVSLVRREGGAVPG